MSQIKTIQHPPVNPQRQYDHLYDKIYTLSSEKDHNRKLYQTKTDISKLKKFPKFQQMFSTLQHFPNSTFKLDQTDVVPAFVDRQWQGFSEQRREAIAHYATINYVPNMEVPKKVFEKSHARSFDRYKYFRRPIIPFLQQIAPETLLQPATVDPLAPPSKKVDQVPTSLTRSVLQQTDFRESETQTDPYTPEYVLRPGSAPEVLSLATLSYKYGLPAGLAEVEMIERARAKRAWEKTLPALHDLDQLEKRRKMMEEMETKEWAIREKEIEELQEARLKVLEQLLQNRENKQQKINEKRLDSIWAEKQRTTERKNNRNRNKYIKSLRKLLKKRSHVDEKVFASSKINQYSTFGSQVHAPLTRVGVFLDRASEQYVVKSKYLDTYQGLLELESSLPRFITQPQFKVPVLKPKVADNSFVKRSDRMGKRLDDVYKAIQDDKLKSKQDFKSLEFLVKLEKEKPRPATPSVVTPSRAGESLEIAAITLQKIIRGRAVQNMMYEGKENRLELIDELRSTHALQKAEKQIKQQQKQDVINLQRFRKADQNKQAVADEVLSSMEGEPVGDLLDFLSKELIRLQEERKIHAYCMLAERRRRIREAEEAGRRQTEERRRREEDEIFKQIVKIHQQTVDTYLEDILMESASETADEQARIEIQHYADKINDIAYAIEDKKTKVESEEIVSDLVHSFLLPEILKVEARKKVKNDQRKHLIAAHKIVHKTIEPAIEFVSPIDRKCGRKEIDEEKDLAEEVETQKSEEVVEENKEVTEKEAEEIKTDELEGESLQNQSMKLHILEEDQTQKCVDMDAESEKHSVDSTDEDMDDDKGDEC